MKHKISSDAHQNIDVIDNFYAFAPILSLSFILYTFISSSTVNLENSIVYIDPRDIV